MVDPQVTKESIKLLLDLVRVLAAEDEVLRKELTTRLEWHLEHRYADEQLITEVVSEGPGTKTPEP